MAVGASQGWNLIKSFSLPAKVLIASAIVGTVVWWVVNILCCPQDVSNIFKNPIDGLLQEKARQQRSGLSLRTLSYRQTVNHLAGSVFIRDYMKQAKWDDSSDPEVVFLNRPPEWLPNLDLLDLPIEPRYFMAIDRMGNIREVYQSRPDLFPQQVFNLQAQVVKNSHDGVVWAIYDEVPFLFAAESVKGEDGEVLGSLLVFCPVDDQFLREAIGVATEWNLIALLAGGRQNVVVSNEAAWIPKGGTLRDLEENFQVVGMPYQLKGRNDDGLQVVSMVRKGAVESLAQNIQEKVRGDGFIQALLYMVALLLIPLWLTRRISNLTRQIENDAEDIVELGDLQTLRGDQVQILGQRILSISNGLRTKTSQLATVSRELDNLTHAVSHDLRAPLRSIDGFSQALEEDFSSSLDQDGRDYLHRVRKATRRLETLIDSLLSLSRYNRQELRVELVDLSQCANDLVDGLRQSEPERQVKVNIAAGIVANGDPQLVRVVMKNLLENAWKFTAKSNDAHIEFGVAERKEVPSEVMSDKHVFFLRDNGVGFDMSFAEKMFAPFQRLHRAEEFPGIGIGLATVQRIIQRHGGRIWAEGEIGQGAIFYFHF